MGHDHQAGSVGHEAPDAATWLVWMLFFFLNFWLKQLFAFRAIGKHHQVSAAHQEGLQAGGWHEDPAVSHQNFH